MHSARPSQVRLAAMLLVSAAAWIGGCSGGDKADVAYPELDEKSRMAVLEAQQRQRAMGTQIASIVSQDDALEFCFEMCRRGDQSCELSQELCTYSRKFPRAIALVATCRFSREQCRRHRKKVPRQCNCDWSDQ